MKRVYLASPYSDPSKRVRNSREKAVTKAAAILIERYRNISFFLPITQSHAMKRHNKRLGTCFEYWKKVDLFEVGESEEVWVLTIPGWDKSIGVTAELNNARFLKKKIRYINPKTYKLTNKPEIINGRRK